MVSQTGYDSWGAQPLTTPQTPVGNTAAPASTNAGVAPPNPLLPNYPGQGIYSDIGQQGQEETLSPNLPIGSSVGPIDQAQQAQLFINQQTPQVNAGIQGAFNLANTQNFGNAPQLSGSPIAGLTTLGRVTNAGNTNINTATSNAITNAQLAQANQLNQIANGQGPNLAAEQARQQGQQNIANEMALIGSQRGSSNSALGLRNAQNAIAGANQQAVQAGVQGTVSQELAAQSALTGALGGAQGQVQQGAQAQAGLNQAINLANANAANNSTLQQGTMNQQTNLANQTVQQASNVANLGAQQNTQQLNTNEYNAALQAQITQANNQLSAQENYANLVTNANLTAQGINQKLAINNSDNALGLASAGIAGGATVGAGVASALAPSDFNLKTNIKSGARDIRSFLTKIGSSPIVSGFNLMSDK